MSMSAAQSEQRRMLVCYAHPDDETFGLGGTIARYAASGVEVHLICATNGDEGTVDPDFLKGYGSVGEMRLAELRCAAEKLGIRQVYTFGYRDSGMMGSPNNQHPDSLWQADQNEVAGRIVEVIRRVRPQVVITFDPYGGYGHPDHIAIHRATLQAFHQAGDAASYPEQVAGGLKPHQPQKLYYPIFPRASIQIGVWLARLRGQDPRHMGKNRDLDFLAVLESTLPTHARLDLRAYYDIWQDATNCHASQIGPRQMFPLPRAIERLVFGWQNFYRAWPEAQNGAPVERDLFAGIV